MCGRATMIRTILLIVFALLLPEGALSGQAPPLLDLAARPAKAWEAPTITFMGSCFDCGAHPDLKLPPEVKLESIEPITGQSQESLVNVLIRNIGPTPYLLPIGRDPDIALKAGNHGRREVWFNLKVAGERDYLTGQRTYGSTDVPDTMMTIPPEGVVRVRFRIDVADELRRAPHHTQSEPPAEVTLKAAVLDNAFDDNPRQYIVHPPPVAISANQLRVRLGKDGMPQKPQRH
jgi:hypothetical protein